MNLESLKEKYRSASESDSYEVHEDFIKMLLSSSELEVLNYHYDLLRERQNRELYLRLRAAFVKRGQAAANLLVEKLKNEREPAMRADILHLLGRMRHEAALPLAREAIQSPDGDFRDRGVYVLGWMGEIEDIDLLKGRLLNDPDPKVRADAATAHDQIKDNLPGAKNKLLANLKEGLEKEKDKKVCGWIIVTIQDIIKKSFGLKEDIEEGEVRGNVSAAKQKCLAHLSSL